MAELKTKPTHSSVEAFLHAIPDERRRQDCLEVARIMEAATGRKPKMWGESIVGFGDYRYKYESGREGEWFLTGFSPRKKDLTLYIMAGFDRYETLMSRLGRFKTGRSCLYLRNLEDVDSDVLTELIRESVEHVSKANPG
jgi:hypothetical protein